MMSEVTTPQAPPKALTIAELETIPNWHVLNPADQKVLGLMMTKCMTMCDAIVALYPTMVPSQVQSAIGFLLVDYRVREVLKFAGVSIPGAPPAPPAVVLPTERIALAELWARREFLDLPPVIAPQSFDQPPTRKINIQKVLAMYFTLARRNWSAAVSMTHSSYTPQEIGQICDTISKDAAIQAVLALVGEFDGK
jgi:hypothetical protein